jgi:CheY-like chemotaxis protein
MTAMAKAPADRVPSAHVFRQALLTAYEQTKRPRSDLRILVADDDVGSLQATVAVLEDEFPGATVISARDGNAALAAAMRAKLDVIVTDLRMPGRDGMELTAALRARRGGPRVPIVVLTGNASTRDWQRLQRLGADQFLVKPIDANLLVCAVRSVTRRRSDQPGAARPRRARARRK